MLKKRLIPVLLLRNGVLVQSRGFKRYQMLGNPSSAVERLSSWASDELIYLDISTHRAYDLNRDDLNHPEFSSIEDIIRLIAAKCFMPLTFGGGIRTLDDVALRLRCGADKITLNTSAIEEPSFVTECARRFGSQCIVISIDAKRTDDGWQVHKGGRTPVNLHPVRWAQRVEELGAGEILLNSINRDGTKRGFDLPLITAVSEAVSIPVIGMGGAGEWSHLAEVLATPASAVAVANMLHHSENSVYAAKQHLVEQLCNVRAPLPLSHQPRNL
ncbi:MAG: imidazole glycerol phosphate synthase cyclase subunit [Myxococcota bacterium]